MRPLQTRLLALVAALALLLPGGAAAGVRYFCDMMEQVTSSCCCPREHKAKGATRSVEARAPDCCKRLASPERADAPSASDLMPQLPPAALVAILEPVASSGVESGRILAAPPQARAPPALGPPLFIVHCALLS